MAMCPFAKFRPISGPSGSFTDGPFKIVHHTTEGSSASGALAAFAKNRSDPHFTIDETTIFQHIDTGMGARALRNQPGGVQTNRGSAIQIEVVGFAGSQKKPATLANVARLCRWLETVHDVPRVWPSGPPREAVNGRDPGGHNRAVASWAGHSGHYGHCHVPENHHWDPAYSKVEVDYLMAAEFDADGKLSNGTDARVAALANRPKAAVAFKPEVMLDHDDVGEPD